MMLRAPINNGIPIYVTHIEPAHEGFIVTVQEALPQTPSMNIDQFKQSMTEMSDIMRNAIPNEDESEVERIIRQNKIITESKIEKSVEQPLMPSNDILGPHIFTSYERMIAFLSIVYEQNIKKLNSINNPPVFKRAKSKKDQDPNHK